MFIYSAIDFMTVFYTVFRVNWLMNLLIYIIIILSAISIFCHKKIVCPSQDIAFSFFFYGRGIENL